MLYFRYFFSGIEFCHFGECQHNLSTNRILSGIFLFFAQLQVSVAVHPAAVLAVGVPPISRPSRRGVMLAVCPWLPSHTTPRDKRDTSKFFAESKKVFVFQSSPVFLTFRIYRSISLTLIPCFHKLSATLSASLQASSLYPSCKCILPICSNIACPFDLPCGV